MAIALGVIRPAVSETAAYTVQAGDTPCEIAESFRVSCASLMEANSLATGSVIYPGQMLVVPTGGVVEPTQAPAQTSETAPTSPQPTTEDVVTVSVPETVTTETGDEKTDLLSVYQMARAQDPIFAARSYQYQAAREAVPQAQAALRPQLSASGAHTEATSDTLAGTQASIALPQALYNRSSRISVTQAGQQVDQAELGLMIASADLVNRAVSAYF